MVDGSDSQYWHGVVIGHLDFVEEMLETIAAHEDSPPTAMASRNAHELIQDVRKRIVEAANAPDDPDWQPSLPLLLHQVRHRVAAWQASPADQFGSGDRHGDPG